MVPLPTAVDQSQASHTIYLYELEVRVVGQLRVLLEELEGVLGGAEGVHQHEAHVAAERLAHLDDLFRFDSKPKKRYSGFVTDVTAAVPFVFIVL